MGSNDAIGSNALLDTSVLNNTIVQPSQVSHSVCGLDGEARANGERGGRGREGKGQRIARLFKVGKPKVLAGKEEGDGCALEDLAPDRG